MMLGKMRCHGRLGAAATVLAMLSSVSLAQENSRRFAPSSHQALQADVRGSSASIRRSGYTEEFHPHATNLRPATTEQRFPGDRSLQVHQHSSGEEQALYEAQAVGDPLNAVERATTAGPQSPTTGPRWTVQQAQAAQPLRLAQSDSPLNQGPPAERDAPGAYYEPLWEPLPDYVYSSAYFDRNVDGARPIADYAPPGYEARPFQDAPGVPEFERITPPAPITPQERDRYVVRGLYPGSFLAPGTNTSFRLRGFVRLAGQYDFDPIGSRDDFVTNTIPVPQESGNNYNMSARYSRFAIETWTPTEFCERNVHTFIEGDFFNGPAQAVGGGGNPFRLRFAFLDYGYFRLGQQNTVFMDGNAFPSTVDFAGPRGLVNQRRPGARVTLPLGERLFWAAGVEQPFSDITTNDLGQNVQDMPDFATHIRYEGQMGHLQVSGLGRSIGYEPLVGDVERRGAWGVSGSAVFHPWAALQGIDPVGADDPSGLVRSRVLLQYTFGTGIGRYIQDTAGLGLDGQVDPITGAFGVVDATGWSASYEHWFNAYWLANATYSAVDAQSFTGQPGATYQQASYLAASLWWLPIPRMSLGVEYLWGERENLDEQRGTAQRLNALAQYNF